MRGLVSTVARFRKLNGVPKNLPTNLNDLSIPEFFKTIYTQQGVEPFLFYDSGPESYESRMLLFTTKANLNAMKIATKAYSDGTFSVVKLFYQLYTLHVQVQR